MFIETLQETRISMADLSSGSSHRSSGRSRHQRKDSVDYGGDLEEEGVWSSLNEIVGGEYRRGSTSTTPRMIRKENSGATDSRRSHPSSAPMNIPDWSKIYRSGGTKADGPSFGSWVDYQRDEKSRALNDDHDHDNEIVPPHEWIARKLAMSQISTSSMCEGIGRTLKGRDLSKVRNAILTKTGFLE
ncbi:hypothetical protein SAY87_002493 [Trapa incisa]|uniref:Senescence regulator n=1 Tax=Trapa incisa TaxID=236973 RepID=A0AAN7JUV4_9MYRT|nr:hypothetical protein SAY87_002493 [Trapa incisa]